MKKIKAADITNFIIRAFFFFAFPSAWVAGFSGFKNLCEQIISGKPVSMNPFIESLIVLIVFTIFFGRFFCGKACAFGTYGDAMYLISQKLQKKAGKKAAEIPGSVKSKMKNIKYLILICVSGLCVAGYTSQLTAGSPWTAFSNIKSLKMDFGTGLAMTGLVLFVLCTIGMMIEKKFFCRFLCPFGAIFSILPVMPFSMVYRKKDSCLKGCRACRNVCPAELDIPYADSAGSAKPAGHTQTTESAELAGSEETASDEEDYQFGMGECFQCGKCTQICPASNAGCLTMPGGKAGIIADIMKAVILAVILYYFIGM